MSEIFSTNGRKKGLSKELRQYIEKRIELLSLTITERVSRIVAESFQHIMGMFILSFALFFLWFAVGFFMGDLVGSLSAGFAISSLPLFIVGFLLLNGRSKKITDIVQAQLINRVFEELDIDFEKEPKELEEKTIEQP